MLTRKTSGRVMPEDWHRNSSNLALKSDELQQFAFDERHRTTRIRNELSNKVKWDQEDNSTRLKDRFSEVLRVKNDLEQSLLQTCHEIRRLEEAKAVTEREAESRLAPIQTAIECLTLRERRKDGDLVKDKVEIQLETELKTFEQSRAALDKAAIDCDSMRKSLQEIRQRLEADIKDKNSALTIDGTQADLCPASAELSFKPDSQMVIKGALSTMAWLENSVDNIEAADSRIKQSQELRDRICILIQTRRRIDEAATRDADFELRVRSHQEESARGQLDWQKQNLISEIRNQENEIKWLEESLEATTNPLKLVQTRLENRKWRSNKDLVEDAAQESLRIEESHLRVARDTFRHNLEKSNEALRSLQNHLRTVDADLERKTLSVNLENKTLSTREKLRSDRTNTSLTEQNLTNTGSLRAHPTTIVS